MNNYFIVRQDEAGEVARFVDGPALANLESALIDLVRRGFAVTYNNATSALLALPAPAIAAPSGDAPPKARKPQRRKPGLRRRRNGHGASADTPRPALARIVARRPAPPAKTWGRGDVVFIAWREINERARAQFDEKREAMGVVEEFRSGKGVRRTVGVRFDSDAQLTWLAPHELSHDCQYCKEERDGQ